MTPVLTFTTNGVADDEVDWTAPSELRAAALRLRTLVLAGDPRVQLLLESYRESANGIDAVHEEFARDLLDVAGIADFAARHGVAAMTLEVNW